MTIRLDDDELAALYTWLTEQVAADQMVGDLDSTNRAEALHQLLVDLGPHLRRYAAAGQVARRTLQLIAWGMRHRPGYREEWLPC